MLHTQEEIKERSNQITSLEKLLLQVKWDTFSEWLEETQEREAILAECSFNFSDEDMMYWLNALTEKVICDNE